ncbi:MAG: hypothetical protein L6R37_004437 [Teloschistes peruensis]|nr:MAG: hypothetical protein L6R37_004437 [Teloschistes peruensis]
MAAAWTPQVEHSRPGSPASKRSRKSEHADEIKRRSHRHQTRDLRDIRGKDDDAQEEVNVAFENGTSRVFRALRLIVESRVSTTEVIIPMALVSTVQRRLDTRATDKSEHVRSPASTRANTFQTTSVFNRGDKVYCDDEYGQLEMTDKRVRWICGCIKDKHGREYFRLKDRPPEDPNARTVIISGEEWILQKDITKVSDSLPISDDGFITIEKHWALPR